MTVTDADTGPPGYLPDLDRHAGNGAGEMTCVRSRLTRCLFKRNG